MTTKLTRSVPEIRERIHALGKASIGDEDFLENDLYGTERSRLLDALPWKDAKAYLRSGGKDHNEHVWEQRRLTSVDQCIEEIRGSLPLAWRHANLNHSSGVRRLVNNMRGLAWLMGDRAVATLDRMEQIPATYFLKPHLVLLSELVGHEWKNEDNDQWVETIGEDPVTSHDVIGR